MGSHHPLKFPSVHCLTMYVRSEKLQKESASNSRDFVQNFKQNFALDFARKFLRIFPCFVPWKTDTTQSTNKGKSVENIHNSLLESTLMYGCVCVCIYTHIEPSDGSFIRMFL